MPRIPASLFKIDKGIPLAPIKHKGNRSLFGRTKYPYPNMSIGDSFGIKYKTDEEGKQLSSLLSGTISARKQKGLDRGKKFAVRKIEEKKEVRVWRIK